MAAKLQTGALDGGRELSEIEQSNPLAGRLYQRIIDYTNNVAKQTVAPATNTSTGVVKPDGTTTGVTSGGTIYVIGATGVSSVALAMPAEFAVAGSPGTGSAVLTVTSVVENKNKVWAGPTTGADAVPSFRALVAADLPAGAIVNFADNEVAGGTLGSWTLAHTPNPAASLVLVQTIPAFGGVVLINPTNYTITGAAITITAGAGGNLPTTGQVNAWYRY